MLDVLLFGCKIFSIFEQACFGNDLKHLRHWKHPKVLHLNTCSQVLQGFSSPIFAVFTPKTLFGTLKKLGARVLSDAYINQIQNYFYLYTALYFNLFVV